MRAGDCHTKPHQRSKSWDTGRRVHPKLIAWTPKARLSITARHTLVRSAQVTLAETYTHQGHELIHDEVEEDSTHSEPAEVKDWQQRTRLLVGDQRMQALSQARVIVVGLGGVGSFAAEFLARAGVGSLTIVDGDTVDVTNANRQLPAMSSTIGQSKVEVMTRRLKDIAPTMLLHPKEEFLVPETVPALLEAGAIGQDGTLGKFDWVVDAIDSVAPKLLLIATARQQGINVMTAMGAGGRLDASRVKVVPLSTTYNDPFAMNIRKNLRRRDVDITQIPAVWSDEPVTPASLQLTQSRFKRSYHGTISYLPAQFGLLAAAHVINMIVQGPMAAGYAAIPTTGRDQDTRAQAVARKREIKNQQRQRSTQMQLNAQRDAGGLHTASQPVTASRNHHGQALENQSGGQRQVSHNKPSKSVDSGIQSRHSYEQVIVDQSNAGWGI